MVQNAVVAGPKKGRRKGPKKSGPGPWATVLLIVAGMLAAAAAWVFLIRAAIDFGHAARAGRGSTAWVFTGLATAGAAVCLLLLLVLAARAPASVGLVGRYRPRRSARSRRERRRQTRSER